MVVANWLILRPLFRPLERLASQMEDADVLRGGQRVPIDSTGEVGALEHSYNTMMQRLEAERREAGARTLHAQEEERQRIARGLHDEVGQTMTGGAPPAQAPRTRCDPGASRGTQRSAGGRQGEPRRRPPNRAGAASRGPRSSRPPQCTHKPGAHVLRPDGHRGQAATSHPPPRPRPAGRTRPLPSCTGGLDQRRTTQRRQRGHPHARARRKQRRAPRPRQRTRLRRQHTPKVAAYAASESGR